MHPFVELAVPAGAVAIHWFEQSSYAIKDNQGTMMLVDPYFPHERPAERFIHAAPPVDEAELPVDYVLLTHDHLDHTHAETLRRVLQASPKAIFAGPHHIAQMCDIGWLDVRSRIPTGQLGIDHMYRHRSQTYCIANL